MPPDGEDVPYTSYSVDRSNETAPSKPKDDPVCNNPLSSSHKFLSQYKIITVIPQEDIEIKQTLEPELEMLARIPKVWRNSSMSALLTSCSSTLW